MAFKILKSFNIFLLLLGITAAAVDSDKSSSIDDEQPTTAGLPPSDAAVPDGRGRAMPLDKPVLQWSVNVAPWERRTTYGFGDPYQTKNRDVEEIDQDDISPSPKKPQRPDSTISGFGGLLDLDKFSSFGGLDGLFSVLQNGPNRKPWWQGDGDDVSLSSKESQFPFNPDTSVAGLGGIIDQFSNLAGLDGLIDVFQDRLIKKPWWQGPNVCVEREETADTSTTEPSSDDEKDNGFFSLSSVNMQSCHSTDTKYECVNKVQSRGVKKSYIVRYQCCLGYRRKEGLGYCEKFELEPMLATIEKLNASDFIVRNGYENKIQTENLTLFVPTNEAFKVLSDGLLELNNIDLIVDPARRRRSIDGLSPSQLVEAHTVNGFHDLSPDTILNSNYKDSTLLIDRYIGKNGDLQYLVNCVKIVSPNNYATTGIVHTVDRILLPVTRNIIEEISNRPEFSIFKEVLVKTGLDKDLAEDETWTVFVPTNKAFAKLDVKTYEMVTKGDSTAKTIVKSHFLGPVLCSTVLEAGVIGVTNANGDIMKLTAANKTILNEIDTHLTNPEVAFYVGDTKVVEADIMATHGVIHAIDQVIIPKSALPLITLLEKENLTGFRDVILQANMADEIDSMTNVTFYVPTNDAVDNYFKTKDSGEVASLLENEKSSTINPILVDEIKGREFVLHHITKGALPNYEMKNNMVTKTLSTQPDALRLNLYSTLPLFPNTFNRATANCARIVSFGIPQRDNLIHLVGKAVPKANESILDIIKTDPKLTYLKKIIADTKLEKDLETFKDITFLAPVNEAFSSLLKDDLDILTTNKQFADDLLRQNALQGVLCCAGLHYSPWPFTSSVRSLSGTTFPINNSRIGSTQIIDCDHVANNGVIHFTSSFQVMMKSSNPNVDIFLYGI